MTNRPTFCEQVQLMKDPVQRELVTLQHITEAKDFIASVTADPQQHLADNITETCHVYRYLRNACVQCAKNQNLIVESKLMADVKLFINMIFDPSVLVSVESVSLKQLRTAVIQFLGNFVVQNTRAVKELWKCCFPKSFFTMLSSTEGSMKDIVCMVLYNCLRDGLHITDVEDEVCWILHTVIDHCSEYKDVEWGLLVVELVLKDAHNFQVLYEKLIDYPSQRTALIDILLGYLNSDNIPEGVTIPEGSVLLLSKQLVLKTQCVMLLCGTPTDEVVDECTHVYKLLQVLSVATGCAQLFPHLRCDEDLLKTSVSLLKQVCECSPASVEGITQQQQQKASDTQHPLYDMKRTLVKIIGNMCYQNSTMQEAIRRHQGITAVLNCCVIDDSNPYLMQWSIFAVRSICEGNVENQNVIKNMKNQGIVDNLLNDTKVATRLENGKIKLCPVDE